MKTTVHKEIVKKAEQLIKKNNLNVTEPRKNILGFLLENHGPFSVEEIHEGLGNKACDLATVYRSIVQFENAKLVERHYLGNEVQRYEYRDMENHHHHIICRICKSIAKMNFCFLSESEKLIRDKGYSDITHSLEFFGICSKCNSK
ncbi:MAG: transcriptional repressor [Candidatus Nitronauta litoralis]|uniref:Transcriptional repressor n=1 Tax=Candidatus Nitronauta litoralis TaxID=2705533 RepID=A0A7T0BX32_9BACT|nr:MAG: transcriptional repressor [Candidatus Nitronauta litoralis]